jgi:hypothetical protein
MVGALTLPRQPPPLKYAQQSCSESLLTSFNNKVKLALVSYQQLVIPDELSYRVLTKLFGDAAKLVAVSRPQATNPALEA